jgi:succinate dehydrogenase / fumarate reductase cytochrome b subunit
MQNERPLSPHLQVYKPQLTSMLSILHRATGVFLMLGTPFLVYWLASIASGPASYQHFQTLASHWFVLLLLLGWTFALFYHLSNGIRHLFWDVGRGFEIEDLYKSGWVVLIAAVILTAGTWALAFSHTGGVA